MVVKNLLIFFTTLFLYASATKKKNILFLVADDMRPNLGAYADYNEQYFRAPKMYTPNLDALAEKSILFNNAFDAYPLCSPSRTSTLTGRRVDTTRVTHMHLYWREAGGNFTTIPQFFKEHGYRTVGGGKVFHSGDSSHNMDIEFSWSEKYNECHNHFHFDPGYVSWRSFTEKELETNELEDIVCGDAMTAKLKELAPKAKTGEEPFFLAMGVKKPHLPFYFPEKYLEHYTEEDIDLPYNPNSPTGLPKTAWHNYRMKGYTDCTPEAVGVPCIGEMNCTYPEWKIKEQRRAYYASTTHADHELGRILDELKNLGLEDDTVVSFWGDHGYHLGESAEWTKQTSFSVSNRVPFMIRIPGVTDNGLTTNQLVEMVDLFPTLVEAAGFDPLEACPENSHDVKLCTEGSSLIPLTGDQDRDHWKDAVFWQMSNGKFTADGLPTGMGYSIRTDEYRYTEYVSIKYPSKGDYAPDWENPVDHEELYALKDDPQENWNLYDDPEYAPAMKVLSERLRAGWRPVKMEAEAK